jgi:hypothetical protein
MIRIQKHYEINSVESDGYAANQLVLFFGEHWFQFNPRRKKAEASRPGLLF